MGFYLDWVSVAGLSKDEVFERLGLKDTGRATDYPDDGDFMWSITPEGRVVLATSAYEWFTPKRLAKLSDGISLVAARAEDNDCTSSAWGYEDGRLLWSITQGYGDLKAEGDLPAEYPAIRDRCVALQEASEQELVNYLFDIPTDLVGVLGGWTPENEIGRDLDFTSAIITRDVWEDEYIGLKRRGGFLSRLFGRRGD